VSSPSTAYPLTAAPPHKAALWFWTAINLLLMVLSIAVAKSSGFVVPG
jgi:hypothetical protein